MTNSKTESVERLLQEPNVLFYEGLKEDDVRSIIDQMQKHYVTGCVILSSDSEHLLKAFKSEMKVIVAGGGFVYTGKETILLIFRKGKWDLPKGKLDEGETAEAAAVREVQEETGLQQLILGAILTTTYHTYYEKETLILKESHWYLMRSPEQQALVPQVEEDIEKCAWVKADMLSSYMDNTHPSIADVLNMGIEAMLQL